MNLAREDSYKIIPSKEPMDVVVYTLYIHTLIPKVAT